MAARASPYEHLLRDLEQSSKVQQEVMSGKRIGFYRLKGQLGAGNFSQVKLGVHLLTHERVAVKIMDRTRLDDSARLLLSREITCMERLEHRNLIRLFEIHESFSRLCLVMECAGEGDVHSRVVRDGPFPEEKARGVFSQVAAGIAHMHKSGVTHRDLKAENVFYTSDTHVKIGDFGFSTPMTDAALTTFCGSPPYAAPELFQEDSYLGPPVDIWAMGVMLYFMVTGNVPFPGNTVPQLKEKILEGSYTMPKRVSPTCQEMLAALLTYKAAERPTIANVLDNKWLEAEGVSEDASSAQPSSQPNPEVLQHMQELGIPTEDQSALLGEPRSAVAGTYRILLHRKLTQGTLTPQPTPLQSTATDHGVLPSGTTGPGRKSSVCVVL